MIRAYIDDSGLWQPPIYVLGGWFAPSEVWPDFSESWRVILREEPRISYFKFTEAVNRKGQFDGWSIEKRNEKVLKLAALFERYPVVGLSSSAPHEVFQHVFGNVKGPAGNAYALLFYGIVQRLISSCIANNVKDSVEFVFDTQPGQMRKVMAAWDEFFKLIPPHFRDYVSPQSISFANDRGTPALQAADLHAGWRRHLNSAMLSGKSIPEPIWGNTGANIRSDFWFMWSDVAQNLFHGFFGRMPYTYTFEYRYPPSWAYNGY